MPESDAIVEVHSPRTGIMVVAPKSDVDLSRSPELRQALREASDRRPDRLIVDLAEVGYMDSSGLATLVEAMRTAKSTGAPLILASMNQKVRAIFEIARLDQFFTIVDSVDAALSV
ncbi:MAG: anti-sigma factor antagonist [Planctomycetota bacterium]|nr:MAG: anti-sigma factor antagonist [Planctomycetota bacterium]